MKIKYFLITIGLLSSTFYITAQKYKYVPFPDSNAVWSEIYWKPLGEPPPWWEYNKFALFNEDTVINGIVYHKLFHTHASEITRKNSECIGGIREDSLKRVFASRSLFNLVPEIKEVLIYDFSLNEGDTLYTNYADSICTNSFLNEYEVVNSIDTILLYNSYRKVYTLDNPNQTIWIEGIGCVQGLLTCWPDWPTNQMKNELVCMHQNDTLMYFNTGMFYASFDDCVPQFVKDGIALLPNTEVKIYPNPATGGTINFEGLDFETLELFDLNGKLIREERIPGMDCYQLDVSSLPPGVYTYRLKTKGLVPSIGKIIVQY
ncbi:MAG: T9SS type A sorting domain-containing protein [Mariniphaga sp.]|nr:T9SS type A sorting domain-containing protein [Mariniphaga sp.]